MVRFATHLLIATALAGTALPALAQGTVAPAAAESAETTEAARYTAAQFFETTSYAIGNSCDTDRQIDR